ncbi:DUF6414 family protein [Rathayibacter festucae]|uniref:DUF6414 family protein n=1 Tax=Rathayibacter festucae TaxID=110937 RepID=UPI002A69DD3D|nr:hypothetical protein [Rathayibacter festucae]MDY0913664.1 hypothetical protein [Rathayibacter festucae]
MGTKKTVAPKAQIAGPVATIYQNSDQIAGILQQIVRQPLITEETRDASSESGRDKGAEASGGGQASGDAKAPLLGKLALSVTGSAGLNASWTETTGTASRQQFVYSQAYYLHLVREHLQAQGHLNSLTTTAQAAQLAPGAFVEYSTTFDPAELALALEVITPELVEEIVRFTVRREYVENFPTEGGHEGRVAHAERMNMEADTKGDLARAVARAVKMDARQDTTREYYGRVANDPDLTAITICDLAHFIVADPDRLLDGTFTVLGKVISNMEDDVPTFARNKLLRNLAPSALDEGMRQFRVTLDQIPKVGGKAASTYLDLKIESRIRGASVRVMPLAIYA